MKLGCKQGVFAFKLIAVAILGEVSCGRTATEERTLLRSMGFVLLQVSAEGTGNASALSLHVSFDELASPPKPVPRWHGRRSHAGQHAASGQNRTQWRQFVRIQTATKEEVDSGTIALACVVVVVVVIFGIFLGGESQYDDYSLENSPLRKRDQKQHRSSNVNIPLRQTPVEVNVGPQRTVSSAPPPGERDAGPTTLRSAPPTEATYAGPASAANAPPTSFKPNLIHGTPDDDPRAVANIPPPSLKGKFLQGSPLSSEESVDHVPQSLPPAHTGSRPGSQSGIQNSYFVQEGRPSSPHSIERLPMASMGVTPAGSGPNLQVSSGDGAMPGGAIMGANQVPSYGSSTPSLARDANQVGKPPPVCKELILPHCEGCFAVAFEHLDSTQSEDFDLYGLSGKPLLRASTQIGPGLQSLSISMKPPKSPTLGSIHVVNPTNGHGKRKMQIRSKNDEYYADFIDTGDMRYVVKRDPRLSGGDSSELLTVNFDRAQSRFILSSSIDGSLLAKTLVSTSSDMIEVFDGKVHLEILVNPGVDPVLTVLCVMAAIMFSG